MLETWRVKKGDKVVVTTGKDKGKIGEILRVIRKEDRVVVKGVNIKVRHQKPQGGNPGGIKREEGAVHVSNVMHVDPKTSKPTRIGMKVLENGKKVRFAKKSGEQIDK